MSRRAPRLQFTDEELAAPEVSKAAKKAAKRIEKLEQAEAKIPTKNGAEKPRPKSKLQHAVRDTPVAAVRSAAHREIRKSEDDNVGVESAHKLEEAAEQTVRAVETAHRSHQLKPYRNADRAEARADVSCGAADEPRIRVRGAVRRDFSGRKADHPNGTGLSGDFRGGGAERNDGVIKKIHEKCMNMH